MLETIFQIILSIFLVLLLAFIGYSVFDNEYYKAIKIRNTVQQEIDVFSGIYDFNSQAITYNTQDQKSPNYLNISPSINQNGGSEYTYNFWLYRDVDEIARTISTPYKTLLLKGVNQLVNYNWNTSGNCLANPINNNGIGYILVKNPLIRISQNGDSIVVEYNTITNVDAINSDGIPLKQNNICNSGNPDANMLGIYDLNKNTSLNKTFMMITVVMQEVSASTNILSKNITNCKMYLNSTLVLDRNVSSPYDNTTGSTAMRNNKGSLYVNPIVYKQSTTNNLNDAVSDKNILLMADLKYFNYALDVSDIESLYNKGFKNKTAIIPGVANNSNYISAPPLANNYKSPESY